MHSGFSITLNSIKRIATRCHFDDVSSKRTQLFSRQNKTKQKQTNKKNEEKAEREMKNIFFIKWKHKWSKTYWQVSCKTEDVPAEKALWKTSPFLAISAMTLATFAVQEDCGVKRLANTWRIPLFWIFSLVSVSGKKHRYIHFCKKSVKQT